MFLRILFPQMLYVLPVCDPTYTRPICRRILAAVTAAMSSYYTAESSSCTTNKYNIGGGLNAPKQVHMG